MQHTTGDEFTWAREGMAELLCEDSIEVKAVTTDPDSSAGRAAESLFKDGLYKASRHITWIHDICRKVSGNLTP